MAYATKCALDRTLSIPPLGAGNHNPPETALQQGFAAGLTPLRQNPEREIAPLGLRRRRLRSIRWIGYGRCSGNRTPALRDFLVLILQGYSKQCGIIRDILILLPLTDRHCSRLQRSVVCRTGVFVPIPLLGKCFSSPQVLRVAVSSISDPYLVGCARQTRPVAFCQRTRHRAWRITRDIHSVGFGLV